MPCVVLDLESVADPEFGALQLAAIHAIIGDAGVATPEDLTALEGASHILVTGSAAMVEEAPWARNVANAIEAAARAGSQVLAICFGHQLLAWHFGGTLASFDDVKRGIRPLEFTSTGPFEAATMELLHSHRDHVIDAGRMVPVATGGFGGLAALRHPDLPIWTCQGHPEWNESLARAVSTEWLDEPRDTPGTADILRRFVRRGNLAP